ncbi:hypothetical protein EYC08_19185 [Tabrizicola sp. WMC-M-20]|nr:hypothetical protein EYC08_19185 [Tabrizicola sp. WMC-M-20]
MAAESATEAALREVATELNSARAEGRLVLQLPLDAIEMEYLLRDRLVVDADEIHGLVQSLRTHVQRTPIDVADLGNGGYRLISGWRRLSALHQLMAGDPAQFGVVLALLRKPNTAVEAYVVMVEENEIRAGLPYWERARVVARTVETGVFASDRDALRALFAMPAAREDHRPTLSSGCVSF